ncbi:MAG TPA: Uma2 family endonuclease [Thermoanaerobaculia bacterium]|nr:Uma2 family endonuclease [Thermoanaerobaculia bacterium]
MAAPAIDVRRWTREEYEHLVEQGFFGPEERLELVDGIIYEMTPQKSGHAAGVRLAHRALEQMFPEGFDVRGQMPLALSPTSEPEPDLSVVTGSPRDYVKGHPTSAVLVIEVSDSTLPRDRSKQKLYAEAGIPDSWILNLIDGCLEVRRDPDPELGTYRTQFVLRAGDRVSPLARPEASIAVEDLLP